MRKVNQFKTNGELVATYKSSAEAARAIGVNRASIIAVCRGKRKSIKGFLFSYDDSIIPIVDEDEDWRDIKGFEGRYQMSKNKKVKSLPHSIIQHDKNGGTYVRTFGEKNISQRIDKEGYLSVSLDGGNYRIHWLYYNTFIGDSSGYVIDHIDRNKLNNDPSNLRLLTPDLNNRNRTLPYKPPIANMNKYYQKKHKETRGGISKPYMLRFTENGKRKYYYFATYEEAENKYRELYNERQKRIDASSKVFTIDS